MTKDEMFYYSENMRRTLEEIRCLCLKKKHNFGCISPPLLDIELGNVRVDELHLLLRITGLNDTIYICTTIIKSQAVIKVPYLFD